MGLVTSTAYDLASQQSEQEPIFVLKIEGVPFVLASAVVYTNIRYDDPDVFYDGTYVYDGLRPLSSDTQKQLIDRKGSSASISQKLEQWDGKASIETFNIKLVDYNNTITNLCTPGHTIEDILNRKVEYYIGYNSISYPEDYLKLFQGYINNVKIAQGAVYFTFTDPSSRRKQVLFNQSTSKLTQPLGFSADVTFDTGLDQVLLSSSPFFNGTEIKFSGSGTLPSPLTLGTKYFVVTANTTNFQVSLTLGGSAIDLTGSPGGSIQVSNFSDTTIHMTSTDNMYRTILDAQGNADPGVTIGLVLDGNEIITYTNANIINGTTISGVTRGAYGTPVQSHDVDIEIKPFIQMFDDPINIALKTMLSGWNSDWVSGIGLRSVINTDDGNTLANSVTFEQGVDVTRNYGITLGDYMTLSGSSFPGNNGLFLVADIVNNGRTIVVQEQGVLTQENPPLTGDITTVAAFRSKYDVYPVDAGLALTPDDVLVSQHEFIRDTFVNFSFDNLMVIGSEASGKSWIETKLFKPIGAYSLTQGSRISVGITHPPLAQDLTKTIAPENVVGPANIVVERGLNSRFFYNEIFFQYDFDVISGNFNRSFRYIDADAQDRMRQVSVLNIDVEGLGDNQTSVDIMTSRAQRILQRYRFAAETVELRTFFSTGHTVDAGDTVVLTDTDPPTLQIANTESSGRGITARVMEVQERSIDVSGGSTKFSLLSNNGYSLSDRYGVVGPASYLDPSYSHTSTQIRFIDSFSKMFPGAEYKKWQDYEGSVIRVHNDSFTLDAETTFTLDVFDPFVMHLTPALPFTPASGMSIQFSAYDASDPTINTLVKATFDHLDSTATIFSASSPTVFTLDSGFSTRYLAGMIIYVMSPNGVRFSPDVKILSVTGDVVTVGPILIGGSNADLGFTPSVGDLVQLGGFKDGGSGYRLI